MRAIHSAMRATGVGKGRQGRQGKPQGDDGNGDSGGGADSHAGMASDEPGSHPRAAWEVPVNAEGRFPHRGTALRKV